MKIHALLAGAVFSVVSVSAAQDATLESERAPVRLLLGLGGTGLIAPVGLAPSLGIAFNVNRVLIMGEGFLGAGPGHIDLFSGGAAGTIFGRRWSEYVLAGAGYLWGDSEDGSRDAIALTLEAGTVLVRTEGGSQIWLGARGFIPLGTLHASDYHGYPPVLPLLSLNLRFWL